jgi:hypothetical protein
VAERSASEIGLNCAGHITPTEVRKKPRRLGVQKLTAGGTPGAASSKKLGPDPTWDSENVRPEPAFCDTPSLGRAALDNRTLRAVTGASSSLGYAVVKVCDSAA